MIKEPAAYSWKHDRRRSVEAYRQWADLAWHEEANACPQLLGNPDYAIGFRDGFVDFVYAGGSGEPPPVPPREYWNVILRTPDGKQRANQWFDGYRHGAQVARDGGYRELGTVDSSLFGVEGDLVHQIYSTEPIEPGTIELEVPWPAGETLPEPNGAPILRPLRAAASESVKPAVADVDSEAGTADVPAAEQTVFGYQASKPDQGPRDEPPRHESPPVPHDEQPPVETPTTLKLESSDSVENTAASATQGSDLSAHEVQTAIFIRLNSEPVRQHVQQATVESAATTVRFVNEPIGGDAAQPHLATKRVLDSQLAVEVPVPDRPLPPKTIESSSATTQPAAPRWKPAQASTIRIKPDEGPSARPTLPSQVPAGVTFER